jgi:Rnl2 family RNA ligase
MTSTFPKYPEIVRLDKRPEILSVRQVVATEKIHGTNFRVHFPEGMASVAEVRFGGRNEDFGSGEQSFYGGRPVKFFKDDAALLGRMAETFARHGFGGVTVFGEAFGTSIQKGVRYAAPGEVSFRAFDIMVGENFVTYDLFVDLCHEMQLPCVPEVWRGEPSLANFDALLEKPSTEGHKNGIVDESNLAEGVVIRSNPLLRDVFGQWLIIKHKSEKFAEVKASDAAKPRADTSAAEEYATRFVVSGRVTNAIGRLRDMGKTLVSDMQDMPLLIPAIVADLQKEAMHEWNEAIARGSTDKQLRGAVTKTLGAVYKRMLLESVEGGKL